MKRSVIVTIVMVAALCGWARAATKIEAETARLGPAASVVADAKASGGKCIEMGSPAAGRVDTPKADAPQATLTFALDAPGKTTVALRALAATQGSDSVHFSIDGAKIATTYLNNSPEWQNHVLMTAMLDQGKHTLRLYTRESGLKIDAIEVSAKGLDRKLVERYPAPPIVPPAGVHPRVLMRPEHIAMIKARRTQGLNATAWAIVQSQAADDTVSGDLPDASKGRYGNYDPKALSAAESKALVYALDGDEARGRQAIQILSDFMRTVRFNEGAQDVTRPIGATIYTGALVYDWCYPLMTEKQRREFIARFEALASTMEIHYPPYGQSAITSHGGEAQLLRDILSASIAVYDESPDMYRMAAGRYFAEFIEAREFFFVSGRHHQGDAYGPYRFKWAVFSAWLFRRMADVDVFSEHMRDVPYSWLYLRRPDGQVLRDGDNFLSGTDYWRFADSIFLPASYYADPILQGELMRQTRGKALTAEPALFVLLNDPSVPTKGLEGLPLTRYRGGPLASMQCRTGWSLGLGSPSVVCDFKGAGYQFNNHHHLDSGSFQIYYKGALAMDPGAYGKYGTPYDYGYNKRSISHNMMLVFDPNEKMTRGINDGGMRHPNGGGEPPTVEIMKTKGYKVGSVLAHDFGPNPDVPFYSYMKIEMAKGYTDKVSAYTRTFCFLNLDDAQRPAAVIVLDDMTTAKPDLKKYWVLHTLEQPRRTDKTIDVRRTEGAYAGRMIVNTLLPEKTDVQLIEDKNRTVDVFGKTFEIPGSHSETAGWRVQVSPAVPAKRDVLLHVMQVMDAGGVEPLAVKKLETDDMLGVSLGNRTVWFAKGANPLAKDVTIDVPEAGQVLLAGLKSGSWEVGTRRGYGQVHHVSGEAGTLFFLAGVPGRYELHQIDGGFMPGAPDSSTMKPTVRHSSASIIMEGKTLLRDKRFEREGDAALIPVAATLELAGVDAQVSGDTLTAKHGGRTLTVKAGEKTYRVNDMTLNTPAAARKEGGDILAVPNVVASLLRMRFTDYAALGDVAFRKTPGGSEPAYWVESVRQEGPPATNPPAMAVDDNPATYWACNAEKVGLVLDLGRPVAFSRVGTSWFHGADRQAFFSIDVSTDGKEWKEVWSGKSSGKTTALQVQKFDRQKARYVRLVCRGNSTSNWNSIYEVKVLKD